MKAEDYMLQLKNLDNSIKETADERDKLIRSIIPDDIQSQIDDINAEFNGKINAVQASREELVDKIKGAVIAIGHTVSAHGYMAVYNKSGVKWDSKGLEGYSVANSDVLKFATPTPPSASLRIAKGKGE